MIIFWKKCSFNENIQGKLDLKKILLTTGHMNILKNIYLFENYATYKHNLFPYTYPYGDTYLYIYIYYKFSLLHIFSLVLQPWMSAYIRKTDGVYISVPQKD